MILIDRIVTLRCRSPCGERGLKCFGCHCFLRRVLRSLPVRGAWIEMRTDARLVVSVVSLPVRGAWIEIGIIPDPDASKAVAPRAGSVD